MLRALGMPWIDDLGVKRLEGISRFASRHNPMIRGKKRLILVLTEIFMHCKLSDLLTRRNPRDSSISARRGFLMFGRFAQTLHPAKPWDDSRACCRSATGIVHETLALKLMFLKARDSSLVCDATTDQIRSKSN